MELIPLLHYATRLPPIIGLMSPSADGGCFGKVCRVSQDSPISLPLLVPALSVPYFDCSLLTACFTEMAWRSEYLGVLTVCGSNRPLGLLSETPALSHLELLYIYLLMYKLNHEYIRTYVVSYLFTNLYNC